jgi:hypothetical protein
MGDISLLDDLDLDRKFFNISAGMTTIFSWTYGWLGGRLVAPIDPNKFDNASSTAAEIGVRVLIVLGAIASLVLAGFFITLGAVVLKVGAKVFKGLGILFQKEGVTHIRGLAPEKKIENGHAKIMVWNIRGSNDHYAQGGVIHWQSRLNSILNEILKDDYDTVILEEIHDTHLIEAIVEHLSPHFAHFYTHAGADFWKEDSGLLVITKCAVHRYSHSDFTRTDEKVRRGFETLEIKASPESPIACARIVATQLTPGSQATPIRLSQINQIIDSVAKEKLVTVTLLAGSLNADRDHSEEGDYLSKYLFHSYLDTVPTHSDQLVGQWAPLSDAQERSSDFISIFKRTPVDDRRTLPVIEKGVRLIDSHLIRAFDVDYNTKTALSDHHALVTEIDGLR